MRTLASDLRYAFRSMRQSPGFYSLVLAVLASGIAATVSVFTLVDGVLLRPLPYSDPSRLVALKAVASRPPFESNGSFTYAQFEQIRASARSLEDIAVIFRRGYGRVAVGSAAEREVVQGGFVSPNFPALFGRGPLHGRWFQTEENSRGEHVVVVGERLAARRFGTASAALGRDLEVDGQPWRIIGVMPADFRVPWLDVQLWAPIHSATDWADKPNGQQRSRRWDLIARLRNGVRLPAAQAEVDGIYGRIPLLGDDYADRAHLVPLREHFTSDAGRPLLLLGAAVAFLLLITLANAGNLMMSRAAARQREFAIRSALGAGAGRLLRQSLAESLALCLTAGALATAAAPLLVRLLKLFVPPDTPRLDDVAVNTRVLLFAIAVSILAAALLGMLSTWKTLRQAADPLRAAGRSATASRETRRLKNALVVAEFALAMVLLTGTSLLVRSFLAVNAVDLGFQQHHLLTLRVEPSDYKAPQLIRFYNAAMEELRGLPGVDAVGAAKDLFQLNITRTHALREIEGHPKEPMEQWGKLEWDQVAGDYFQALGVPLLRGRFFDRRDTADAPPVVIVNETLARRYWPGEDPIGKRLRGMDPRGPNGGKNDDWLTVVGMVRDMRSSGAEHQPYSQIYEPQSQSGENTRILVVRTKGDPAAFAAAARAAVREADPRVRVAAVTTVDQELYEQESDRRLQTWITGLFSAMALLLAALGVFAVMHFSVAAKTREIGIRMAIGARPGDILRLMLGDGAKLALVGIALGAFASEWTTEALRGLLFGVTPTDAASFAAAAAILGGVALAACYLPATRASRLDPVSALRDE